VTIYKNPRSLFLKSKTKEKGIVVITKPRIIPNT
jgi:hypothetical protein